MKSTSPAAARIALAVPALILLSVLGAMNYNSRQKVLGLAADGVDTSGEISTKNCRNHGEMTYSFVVNAKHYSRSGFCPLNCENATVGTPITVTYSKHDPNNSTCESAESYASRPSANYWSLIILAAGLMIVIYRITRTNVNPSKTS